MASTTKHAARRRRRGRVPLARIAHHEAGHAVVAEALGLGVESASIVPEPAQHSLGRVQYLRGGTRNEEIIASYAGPLAEVQHARRALRFAVVPASTRTPPQAVLRYGARRDLADAAETAGILKQFSDASERRAYMRWLWERARVLVGQRWPEIEAVAAELLARRTMSGDEVRRVLSVVRERDEVDGAGELPGWLAPFGDG